MNLIHRTDRTIRSTIRFLAYSMYEATRAIERANKTTGDSTILRVQTLHRMISIRAS
jgi:hypothetical protein